MSVFCTGGSPGAMCDGLGHASLHHPHITDSSRETPAPEEMIHTHLQPRLNLNLLQVNDQIRDIHLGFSLRCFLVRKGCTATWKNKRKQILSFKMSFPSKLTH